MVTKYERQLERAAVAKRMKGHADQVHAVAVRVPFWHVDNTDEAIMMRDTDGNLLITFHGVHAPDMAKWLSMLGRMAGMRQVFAQMSCRAASFSDWRARQSVRAPYREREPVIRRFEWSARWPCGTSVRFRRSRPAPPAAGRGCS